MTSPLKNQRTCSRSHSYQKSSDCPVCPSCWPGYYRQKNKGDFPDDLSSPALRALLNEKIFNLSQLSQYSEAQILAFHGMGPASLPTLRMALQGKNLSFNKD